MSTVNDIVNRVYSDYLHAGDDQPVVITLAANLAAGGTSVTYDDDTLLPDEEDALAQGVLIEFPDGDQARITAVDDSTNVLTVTRGVNGKTATAHVIGDEIIVAPIYDRANVITSVYDAIVGLYPALYRTQTDTVTTTETYIEVDADAITPRQFMYVDGTRYWPVRIIFNEFFPPSTTGKAVFTPGLSAGYTAYFTWEGRFPRPTALTDDMSVDLGVRPEWERIVVVAAAAAALASRPPSDATVEYITEQLQRQSVPTSALTDVRNGLLTLQRILLDEARAGLQAERQPAVIYNQLLGGVG